MARIIFKSNGFDLGTYIAEDGISVSKDVRNEKSLIARDGTMWKSSNDKLILDVSFLDMSDSQFTDMVKHFRPNPASIIYTDFEKNRQLSGVPFYVTDVVYTDKKTIGNITYLTGISVKFTQK